ncbi:MAG TPA: TraR/DksA C4-type zinc finger protein [Dehalococcoidia bacterium]|nr:TraR/DksA C4-type zinc finger protein [Dehalococcoidia bacterium]
MPRTQPRTRPHPQAQRTAKDALERKARRVQHLLEEVEQTAFAGDAREVSGEISLAGQDDGDVAAVLHGREEEQMVRELLQQNAAQIEDARRRRQEGTYGICEDCGSEIPPARLQAMPEATRCIGCQRSREAARRG